ncbi:putative Acetylxylan esterase A [Truncatella angustata]|uniref:Carboxylic ester hydrolase n=1 Tax=Truncatella angustata TaxID=152316 RepID=A0A9P8UTJ2_9PEZI|nr:putative Acetylxylan esterase A [Truncatella angustata]KAH6657968.1 putative Acetylxylan esterase A [Truncatella angustata]
MLLSSLLVGIGLFANVEGALTRVTDFGTNPAGIEMYIDASGAASRGAPIIVGLHGCHGTAQGYYQDGNMATLAKQRGAILIYPSSTHDLLCWDCGTSASLTRYGGGDPTSIVQMVDYAIGKYNADADRVFIVGTSSGAMMGNVLSAIYPDVFSAAVVYSGTAAGCMAVPPGTPPNPYDPCGLGRITKTPQQWGNIVRGYYPGYTGAYPRMQIWHGTADTTVVYHNFDEELKEWSNVLGVSFGRNSTNNPQSGYTEMIYGTGDTLVGYSARGVGHVVPQHPTQALSWFGL